jgi:hypothetical protein
MPPGTRTPAREAGAELLCLQAWEQHAGWIVEHTAKWPKSARFSLVQKVDNHALAVLELLVVARYEPKQRSAALREANLRLEQLRFLLRIALQRRITTMAGFETALRGIDELGRMVHGWRATLAGREASGVGSQIGESV